ncbi:MAG: antitoxin Xre/MbcA/ParS toxin-binding domain-containing protein [Gammaproteobacteria bacterium]
MTQLLAHTLLSAHDPNTGRYDARRLASVLALTNTEMATLLGYTPRGLSKNPVSPRLQPRMAEVVRIINRLRELLDGNMEYVRIWLKAPHPDLDGRTPLSYLEEGKSAAVETLIHMIETGQPG